MILESLPQWRYYAFLNPRRARRSAFLEQATPDIADSRHEIDGDAMYALVQRYETPAATGQCEDHRRSIDIWYLVRSRAMIQ